jgi:lysylphosphatidylglycerol synthetase-like protein (DUF2156 family)
MANLILFLIGLVFIYYGLHAADARYIQLLGIVVCLVAGADQWRKHHQWQIHYTAAIVAAITWFCMGYWWVGLLLPALSYLAQQAAKHKQFAFAATGIQLMPPFARQYAWKDFQNVVLKDDLLTLDFTNNKILQAYLLHQQRSPAVNEAEFNDFCKRQLANKG